MIPADNPRFAITVIMKDPQGTYGGMTAYPVFAKIGEFLYAEVQRADLQPAQRCYCSGLVRPRRKSGGASTRNIRKKGGSDERSQ